MTNARDLKSAADLIWGHWQAGTSLDALPDAVRPRDRASGYAVQSLVVMHGKNGFAGWKIAATSKAGQAHIGVDGPMAGRLLSERCHPSGATLSLAGNRMRVAEPEFAFRIGHDLPPRRTPYTFDEALAAMDALIPAIEVPDSRFTDFSSAGAAQLIADMACAHDLVLGEPANVDWRRIDLAAHAVHAVVAGRSRREGTGSGANVLGDPRIALTWIVNELSGLGVTLSAGEVIITGACLQPIAIEPGDEMTADFGTLGRISARFT